MVQGNKKTAGADTCGLVSVVESRTATNAGKPG